MVTLGNLRPVSKKQSQKMVALFSIEDRSKLKFMSYHYCVLPIRRYIDSFTCNQLIKDTSSTKAFYRTTHGNWTYISAECIFKCSEKKSPVDPKDSTFQVDVSTMSSFRKIRYQPVAPQLQRQSWHPTTASANLFT